MGKLMGSTMIGTAAYIASSVFMGKSALEAMNSAVASPYSPITPAQIQQLVASLPLEASGMINYKDFMAAFEVRDKLNDA